MIVMFQRVLARWNYVSKTNSSVQEQSDRFFIRRIDDRASRSADLGNLKT